MTAPPFLIAGGGLQFRAVLFQPVWPLLHRRFFFHELTGLLLILLDDPLPLTDDSGCALMNRETLLSQPVVLLLQQDFLIEELIDLLLAILPIWVRHPIRVLNRTNRISYHAVRLILIDTLADRVDFSVDLILRFEVLDGTTLQNSMLFFQPNEQPIQLFELVIQQTFGILRRLLDAF